MPPPTRIIHTYNPILLHLPFAQDLALNSVYASGWSVLAELALEVGNWTAYEHCQEQFQTSSQAIQALMWDETANSFQSVYTDSKGKDQFSKANSVQNLFPLLLKDLPVDKVDLIASQLADEAAFNAPFSIPTVSLTHTYTPFVYVVHLLHSCLSWM